MMVKDQREQGSGNAMLEWAINKATENGAHVLHLTTDKQRPKAIQYYIDLGLVAMKRRSCKAIL